MKDAMSDDRLYVNGINGATGQYLTQPVRRADVAAAVRAEPQPDPGLIQFLQKARQTLRQPFAALPFDIIPQEVPRAGWAVVFPTGTPDTVRQALQPLIDHRRRRVPPDRCLELDYQPGEAMRPWLQRHGVSTGRVAPTKVPYYVLLVGGPDAVPFEFQYLLDVEYAVGRLTFDAPQQYRQYAESVIAYETAAAAPHGKEVVYWGTRHPGDFPTRLSADSLITPLAEGVPTDPDEGEPVAPMCGFRSRLLRAAGGNGFAPADKAGLLEALHAPRTGPGPAVLFTASHGLGWPCKDERQATAQGALLCQNWSGLGSVLPEHYLAAADVAGDARVHGLVAFLYACFGAGTPRLNGFLFGPDQPPPDSDERLLAERSFMSALPQRLLSHPQGGALAVIGHVERAWAHSIQPLDDQFRPLPRVGPLLTMFRNCVGRILRGDPVGHATKDISEKYANLSADLLSLIGPDSSGTPATDAKLVNTWIERNDAQNYVLLGDPAVRLRLDVMA
jgi:hypothetical protein